MTQTKQQNLKITAVQVQKIPATVTSPATAQQQTTTSNTDWASQTIQAQAQAPPIAPPVYISQVSSLAVPTTPALTQTRITVPDYEEKYKKLLAAQAEAKRKKKKSLIDSILDEIVRYGFFIVLGIVILVVVFALRKDKETPGTGFQMPQHPGKHHGEEQEGPKKDIWHDEF